MFQLMLMLLIRLHVRLRLLMEMLNRFVVRSPEVQVSMLRAVWKVSMYGIQWTLGHQGQSCPTGYLTKSPRKRRQR